MFIFMNEYEKHKCDNCYFDTVDFVRKGKNIRIIGCY